MRLVALRDHNRKGKLLWENQNNGKSDSTIKWRKIRAANIQKLQTKR